MNYSTQWLGMGIAQMLQTTPIVFVVDDDISVRESLELLIRHEGLKVETFTSAQEFSRVRVSVGRVVWCSTSPFPG
jgi:DNA-binding NtrC family response regulator